MLSFLLNINAIRNYVSKNKKEELNSLLISELNLFFPHWLLEPYLVRKKMWLIQTLNSEVSDTSESKGPLKTKDLAAIPSYTLYLNVNYV